MLLDRLQPPLRSAVVVTDANGNIVERTTYYAPYGRVLNRPMRDGPGYAGAEEDLETSLVYMQQRYYDPEAGRFISTDPVPASAHGSDFNRYAYAKDNPYRYTDPDGRYTCGEGTSPDACTTIANYDAAAVVALMYSSPQSSEYDSIASAVAYLGFPGQQNGVTVTDEALPLAEKGNAPLGGNINIDVTKINHLGSTLRETGRNSDKTIAEVQSAVGAGVLLHEATHKVDYLDPNIGYPHSYLADALLEIHAYSVERAVGASLGMGEIGLSTQHEFNSAIQSSVETFCSNPQNGCQ